MSFYGIDIWFLIFSTAAMGLPGESMKQSVNRMQFLRGRFNGRSAIRPPWSMEESRFTDLCDRCDACISACHAKIIHRGEGGFPEINFSRGGCDFCRACVQACPSGAISKESSHTWSVQASFKSSCLAERGVICRSCGDVCEHRAIRFRMRVGGSAMIEFNPAACTGCGECVSLCPVQAIEIKPLEITS